jgi:hypothetical protein
MDDFGLLYLINKVSSLASEVLRWSFRKDLMLALILLAAVWIIVLIF